MNTGNLVLVRNSWSYAPMAISFYKRIENFYPNSSADFRIESVVRK